MGFKWMLTLLPCGDHWRRGRRLIHSYFGQAATPTHHDAQVMAARRLARDILDAPQTPETLAPLVQFNFAQTIMKIMYGIDAQDKNDPYVLTSEKVVEALNVSMVPGKFLVDFMPLRTSSICGVSNSISFIWEQCATYPLGCLVQGSRGSPKILQPSIT
jgi:hypothetical protein